MNNWKKTLVSLEAPLLDVIKAIDGTCYRIALVVDKSRKLIGTITDGDIRRGLLRSIALSEPAVTVMNKQPIVAARDEVREVIVARLRDLSLTQMPVVDDAGFPVGIETINNLGAPNKNEENWVLLMAGGLGTRLRPLTNDTPKPMLKVGDKPILETIIDTFVEQGFRKFCISVNYKADIVCDHFEDGRKFGAEIRYLQESEPLGTAGCLSLIDEEINVAPLLIMNGDLLTKLNFRNLIDYHAEQRFEATMCVREYDIEVPFGVVELDHHRVVGIEEKPVHKFFVNAGIYVLNPDAIRGVPNGDSIDMPTYINSLHSAGKQVGAFPIREFWLDIGRMEDFERANGRFS